MALTATDWTIERDTKAIVYTGNDHNGAAPSYATVIEFHRWLQGLADDAVATAASDDELDITNPDPSRRSTDNIITLINGYTISDTEAEHLYDGSINQNSGDDIYDGIVNFGNADVQIQIIQNGAVLSDDFWNYSEGGQDSVSTGAAFLTDTGQSWTTNEWVGYILYNVHDTTSSGVITANDATTITAALTGGTTDNLWNSGDDYLIGKGLNPSSTAGISHRFMIKTRSGGTDIDGKRLIGTARKFGYTYSEFSINGTSNGNNVLALTDAADLNNETSIDTVSGWTGITNTTEGYINLDVNNDGTDEYYYAQWNTNQPTRTINDFYERMKWLSRDGSASTFYGLNGELFRGITHQILVTDATSGIWVEPEALSWGTGATAGTGQLLAIDNTASGSATILYMQILTGVVPNANLITGATNGASGTAGVVTERTISKPFCGASTGSAIIGGYGLGIETLDLSSTDKVTSLANVVITPPNNITNTVTGLVSGEDRILLAPWDGSTNDTNGDPAILKTQFSNTGLLNGAAVVSIEVDEAIPTDTPASGYLRVTDDNGYERRLHYSEVNTTTKVFTIDTSDGNEVFNGVTGSGDYQASIGNNIYLAYIDELAGSSTATYTSVHATAVATRDLVLIVRDGAGTPIKQYISGWSQTSSNQSISVIRTTDA